MGFFLLAWFQKKPKKSPVRIPQPPDIPVPDGREDDIVILTLSITGAGKSTFIKTALGRQNDTPTIADDDLNSCTTAIQPFIVTHPGDSMRRIVFVDTPGFDGTFSESDTIRRRIDLWLKKSYGEERKVGGIIYLHDISQAREHSKPSKDLAMCRKWCGSATIRNVVLITTQWEKVPHPDRHRAHQLFERHWKDMLNAGAKTDRFMNVCKESAWNIVNSIL